MLALLEHVASVTTPGRGAPKLLLVVSHMATRDWLDGELRVKLIGDDDLTVLELFVDAGMSRERILGPLRIDAPLREFRSALELHPERVAPLDVVTLEDRRVILETTPELRRNSTPPKYSAVSDSLLPLMGMSDRTLPTISDGAPPEPEETDSPDALPEIVITEVDEDIEALLRPQFKPMSLPPRLKDALSQIKKK